MRKVAFLSMDDLSDFVCYDQMTVEPLQQLGWSLETVPWRDHGIIWDDYEMVIIRSPWDYQDDPEAFFSVLEDIEASTAHLENPLEVVRWNLDKIYLRDLEQDGIPIVPTLWAPYPTVELLRHAAKEFNNFGEELIIKPRISANADHTYRLSPEEWPAMEQELHPSPDRNWMIQPFLASVIPEGEFSLFYFGNRYSHAIVKRPKTGDFRVQEEHGGQLSSVKAPEALKKLSSRILSRFDEPLLYSRLDFLRDPNGIWRLVELELIEPSLYFNMDPESASRFARALDAHVTEVLR